jgi:hypothetical protein
LNFIQYFQDTEDIDFDSNNELISVFSMQANNSNKKSTSTNLPGNEIGTHFIDLTNCDSEKRSHLNKQTTGKFNF